MAKGNFFVLSAPSGTGKTTLIKKLLKKIPNLYFSVSHTTREKRENEREGNDYYFISESKFKEMIKRNKFIEWAKVHNHYYGTSKKEVLKKLNNGKDVLLDIDTKGSQQIKKSFPKSIHIFLLPPSFEELNRRLRGRGDLKESDILIRLKNAKKEIMKWKNYDYIVVNDKIEETLKLLISIIISTKQKTENQKEKINSIILSFKKEGR